MLTPKQHELLLYLGSYIQEHGYSPTYETMAAAVGLRSKSGIVRLVRGLAERGFIRHVGGRNQSIEVVRPVNDDAAPSASGQRFETISRLLAAHIGLLCPQSEAPVQMEKATSWLAAALVAETDDAAVALRLRRLSAALANAAAELARS